MAEELTIVVCTHNRARTLDRMLASLCRSMSAASETCPIVVVDNASADRTPAVLRTWARRIPLRRVAEPVPGLSAARNRAVAEIKRGALWFLDDDVLVTRRWVAAARRAVNANPRADWIGGRILPRWDAAPPSWFPDPTNCPYQGLLVWYDPGPHPRDWTPDIPAFFGANLMFRRRVFDGGLRFDTHLGRIGTRVRLGEEAALQEALRRRGRTGRYVPAATVYHPVPPERLRLGYLWNWHLESGRAPVRLAARAGMPHCWHGVPRFVYRQAVEQVITGAWQATLGAASLSPVRAARGLSQTARGLGQVAEIGAHLAVSARPFSSDSTTRMVQV